MLACDNYTELAKKNVEDLIAKFGSTNVSLMQCDVTSQEGFEGKVSTLNVLTFPFFSVRNA